MKLTIDLGNRSIRLHLQSLNPDRLEWDALSGNYEVAWDNTGTEAIGVGMEFDGTLDIKVIDRDRKTFDFLVVGDGLA